MKPIALDRKNFHFVGSEGGGKSAAIACTPIETAKLSGVDPLARLTDVPGCIADHKITRLDELLPWRYVAPAAQPSPAPRRQSALTGRSRIATFSDKHFQS